MDIGFVEDKRLMENLGKIDNWKSDDYHSYYLKLIPFFKNWYNVKEGYRPVVMGRNIVWWLENKEVRRKCNAKLCKRVDNKECNCEHKILDAFNLSKLSCWVCELDEKRTKSLSTGWIRYYEPFNKVLWDVNTLMEKSGVLKTVRSLYWQPAIRKYELINIGTDKSWNEITAENFVIDIDIINKNVKCIFDKEIWNDVYNMVIDVDNMLNEEGIESKLQFSGNGIYFITKRIVMKDDIGENETVEQFWNIISEGWKDWVNEVLKKKIEEKYKMFDVEGESPYTMKFFKTPFSLHQRLDTSAIPISIDILNKYSNDSKGFEMLCKPNYVTNNYNELLKAWD